MTHVAPKTTVGVFEKCSKAISAGIGAGIAAFVPLASGVSHLAVIADVGMAFAVGIGTAIVTYLAPANKGS